MIVSLLTVAVLVLAGAGSAALYLLPVLIGSARRVPDLGAVAVINVLLGWTLAGWAVALAMSLRSVRPAPPAVQVMQNLPPSPPPGPLPPAGWPAPPGAPPPRPGFPPPLSLPPRPGSGQDPAERRQSGTAGSSAERLDLPDLLANSKCRQKRRPNDNPIRNGRARQERRRLARRPAPIGLGSDPRSPGSSHATGHCE
jgi:hypothetical protein